MPKKSQKRTKNSGNAAGPHPVPMDWTLVTLPLPPMIPLREKRQLTDREEAAKRGCTVSLGRAQVMRKISKKIIMTKFVTIMGVRPLER